MKTIFFKKICITFLLVVFAGCGKEDNSDTSSSGGDGNNNPSKKEHLIKEIQRYYLGSSLKQNYFFEYEGTKLKKITFEQKDFPNPNSNPMNEDRIVETMEFFYEGNLITKTIRNLFGQWDREGNYHKDVIQGRNSEDFTYNQANQLIEVIHKAENNKDGIFVEGSFSGDKYVFIYNPDKSVTRHGYIYNDITGYNRDGYEHKYFYDENSNLIKKQYTFTHNYLPGSGYTEYKYDDKKNPYNNIIGLSNLSIMFFQTGTGITETLERTGICIGNTNNYTSKYEHNEGYVGSPREWYSNSYEQTYDYEYDKDNYPIKMTFFLDNSSGKHSYEYKITYY